MIPTLTSGGAERVAVTVLSALDSRHERVLYLFSDRDAAYLDRIAPGVRLVVERPGAPLVVHTDAGRVRQVLDGLAANAVRLTPAGGLVVLAVRATATGALLEVRDGGPGLTAEDRAVAFEPGALGAEDEVEVGGAEEVALARVGAAHRLLVGG